MKKFKGHINSEELKSLSHQGKITLDTTRYDSGDDWVLVGVKGIKDPIIYNPLNGRFIGKYRGKVFSSDDKLDVMPWFSKLLNLFYKE